MEKEVFSMAFGSPALWQNDHLQDVTRSGIHELRSALSSTTAR